MNDILTELEEEYIIDGPEKEMLDLINELDDQIAIAEKLIKSKYDELEAFERTNKSFTV